MKKLSTFILFCALSIFTLFAQSIERVEPPCWWVDMKTNLQLMVYGKNLSQFTNVSVLEKGIKVTKIHKTDSPDYLFLDIAFPFPIGAKAGLYTIKLQNEKDSLEFKYLIKERRQNSAKRESFGPQDMIYLLMPDRFVNGDRSNDNVEGYPDRYNKNDYNGRHGGDLRGMINKLDYLSNLGVTTILSTPLTEDNEPAVSYDGYACSDYYKIDPRYGTNEIYKEFVDKAHNKGIKVMMDVVTNHCGAAHWWMNNLPLKGWINPLNPAVPVGQVIAPRSQVITANSDPNASAGDLALCNRGWLAANMPDLKTENPYVLQYFKQLFIWWIEWADLDGLRIDSYPYHEKNAIAEWTKAIRKEYPNLRIVGECTLNEPALVAYWEGNHKNRDKYDSYLTNVMDFPLQGAFGKAFSEEKGVEYGEGMAYIYNVLASDFVYDRPGEMMIFLDNHQTKRWADIVKKDNAKIKIGLAMLATIRGIPQLYYGTEGGLASKDLAHEQGSARVLFGEGANIDFTDTQKDLLEYTKKLFNWRKTTPVIHTGKTMHFAPVDNVYAYVRYNDKNAVLVVVNASLKEQGIDWKRYSEALGKFAHGKNVLNGNSVRQGEITTIAPQEALIIEF